MSGRLKRSNAKCQTQKNTDFFPQSVLPGKLLLWVEKENQGMNERMNATKIL